MCALSRLEPARLKGLALIALLLACTPSGASVQADPRRETFLAAETALEAGRLDQVPALLASIKDYPLTPHLELRLAEKQLARLPHDRVERLVRRYADVPAVRGLRGAWLSRLAKEGRHRQLLANADAATGRVADCLAAQAAWQLGDTAQAWQRVASLWPTARSLPDVCDPVLSAWRKAGQLTSELGWTRFALVMERNNLKLARFLARGLTGNTRALADRWLALRGAPADLPRFVRDAVPMTRRHQRIIENVFARLARRDVARAQVVYRKIESLGPSAELRVALRERVGMALADQRAPDALDWLADARSASALRVRAVAGIRRARLDDVAAAVRAMPQEERSRERWRYWQARGLEAKDPAGARDRLLALAGERSYYGFLAADRLRRSYEFGDRPIDADAAAVAAIAAIPGTMRAREWLALDRPKEARREWQQILSSQSAPGLRAAARLADDWMWHEAAIRAAAAAQHWSDLSLRFPVAHRPEVEAAARKSGLRAERIYAVVRQESAFMRDIRSRAGALGLMQLMPATARQVAKREKLPRPRRADILDPARNLKIGSLYMNRLEQRYDGNTVLATAAYNAGPGRVKQWRPPRTMASESWIELIPFKETRRYVRSVLAYHVIYAHRLGAPAVRMASLMPDVTKR